MNAWEAGLARGGAGASEVALWTGAALVVLAAHAGAVAWFMRDPPTPAVPAASPAIAIELAPMPVTEESEETDLSPDEPMVEADDSLPRDAPEEIVEPDPQSREETPENEIEKAQPEEVREPAVEEIDEEEVETPPAAVPLPRPRPESLPRRARSDPPREQASPAPRTAAPPRVEAERASRTAAPQSASREPAPQVSPARWQQRLLAHLERHKRYPSHARARREEGTVHLAFTIDAAGRVTGATITRSSGHAELDQAVLDMIRRASPVPAPLDGISRNLTVPVRFSLR